MALSGTIADWSFADILQVIAAQRKSGTLRLECGDQTVALTIHEGRIVDAQHKQPARKSGFLRFLVETGRIAPTGARKILELAEHDNANPIQVVESSGLVQGERLETAFEAYVQELVYLILQWQEGSYEFIAHHVTPQNARIALGTEGLLIEGMRRIDEWVRIAEIVQPETVFRTLPGATLPEDMPRRERSLLRLIDGIQDVYSLTRLAPLTQYEVGETIMNLYQWGLVEVATDGHADMSVVELRAVELENENRLDKLLRIGSLVTLMLASIAFGLVTSGADWAADTDRHDRTRDLQAVRFALDFYHQAHGRYPERLGELPSAGLDIGAAGRRLVYRTHDVGQSYSLVESGPDQAWHLRLTWLLGG